MHVPSGLFAKNVCQKWISKQSTIASPDSPLYHCYRPSNGRTLLLSLVLLIATIVWYIYFILPCLFGFLKFKLWQLGRTHSVGVNKSHQVWPQTKPKRVGSRIPTAAHYHKLLGCSLRLKKIHRSHGGFMMLFGSNSMGRRSPIAKGSKRRTFRAASTREVTWQPSLQEQTPPLYGHCGLIPHIHHGFAWRWWVFTGEGMAEKDLYVFTSLVLNRKKREEMHGAGLSKTPPGTNFGWWWRAPQIHRFSSFFSCITNLVRLH